jgi:hypothetical protein
VRTGSLDVGFEYVYAHRNIFGGTTIPAGSGLAAANRAPVFITVRF